DLLKERYADTKSYKDRVLADAEINDAMNTVLKRSQAIAKVTAPAPKPVAPTPAPGPEPKPKVEEPKPETPEPPPPKPVRPQPEAARSPDPERPPEPTSVAMPDGTNQKISDLVAKGDKLFNEAMVHLRNSDPSINPDSWAEENKKALKFFMEANRD